MKKKAAAPPEFLAPPATKDEDHPDDDPSVEPAPANTAAAAAAGRPAPRRAAPHSRIPTSKGNGVLAQYLEFVRVMTGSDRFAQQFVGVVFTIWPCLVVAGLLAGASVMIWTQPNPMNLVVPTAGLIASAFGVAWVRRRKKS